MSETLITFNGKRQNFSLWNPNKVYDTINWFYMKMLTIAKNRQTINLLSFATAQYPNQKHENIC